MGEFEKKKTKSCFSKEKDYGCRLANLLVHSKIFRRFGGEEELTLERQLCSKSSKREVRKKALKKMGK